MGDGGGGGVTDGDGGDGAVVAVTVSAGSVSAGVTETGTMGVTMTDTMSKTNTMTKTGTMGETVTGETVTGVCRSGDSVGVGRGGVCGETDGVVGDADVALPDAAEGGVERLMLMGNGAKAAWSSKNVRCGRSDGRVGHQGRGGEVVGEARGAVADGAAGVGDAGAGVGDHAQDQEGLHDDCVV